MDRNKTIPILDSTLFVKYVIFNIFITNNNENVIYKSNKTTQKIHHKKNSIKTEGFYLNNIKVTLNFVYKYRASSFLNSFVIVHQSLNFDDEHRILRFWILRSLNPDSEPFTSFFGGPWPINIGHTTYQFLLAWFLNLLTSNSTIPNMRIQATVEITNRDVNMTTKPVRTSIAIGKKPLTSTKVG